MRQQDPMNERGVILDQQETLTLGELARACSVHAEWIISLVEEGTVEPRQTDSGDWLFEGRMLRRARIAVSLQRDLEVNSSGAALAVDLLEQLDTLRSRLRHLQ